jgi:hypothetical protein
VPVTDHYEHRDLDEIDFTPVVYDEERPALLMLGEAYALLSGCC